MAWDFFISDYFFSFESIELPEVRAEILTPITLSLCTQFLATNWGVILPDQRVRSV